MAQHRRQLAHNGSYYLYGLLAWRLAQLRTTPRQTAIKAGISKQTMADALAGECKKMSTLWSIALTLGLKWEYLFKLDLPPSQFWRAVLNVGSESVR